jgi:hypothetical protein
MHSCFAIPRDPLVSTAQEPFGRAKVSCDVTGASAPLAMEEAADL